MFARSTLLIVAFTFSAFSADHLAGTWKLNATKSKYVQLKTPREETVTYTPAGEGYTYSAKITLADGQTTSVSFRYTRDGEDMFISGASYPDTLTADALKLEDGTSDNSTGTFKRNGKVVGTMKRTISRDGKTMTVTGRLVVAELCPVSVCGEHRERATIVHAASYTSVYEKQ